MGFPFFYSPKIVGGDTLFGYKAGQNIATLGGTFTRASLATYETQAGLIQTVASNVIRDGHYVTDPVTLQRVQTTLLESQRTNLFLNGASAIASSLQLATSDSSAEIAPDGTLGAILLSCTGVGTSGHSQQVTATSTEHTFSIYLKKGAVTNWARLGITSGGINATNVYFDLLNGVVGTVGSGITGTKIEAMPNGWYRCSIKRILVAGPELVYIRMVAGDNISNANGSETLHIWGGQVEAGAFESSYIPTVASSVSRAQDNLVFPWNSPPEAMSVYAKFYEKGNILQSSPNGRVYAIARGTGDRFMTYTSGGLHRTTSNPGAILLGIGAGAPLIGDRAELLSTHNLNGRGIFLSINGGTTIVGTSAAYSGFPAAYIIPLMSVNMDSDGTDSGFGAFVSLIFAKGNRDLAYFRALP